MVTTGSFSATFSLLEPGLRALFQSDARKIPQFAEAICVVKDSTKRTESFRTMAGFGAALTVTEGGAVSYDDPTEGYLKQLTHVKYGLGFQVTQEMHDDDQTGFIRERPGKLARSLARNVETVAANIFNNGYTATTGTLTADALSLFNTAHTLLDGTTYANRPSTDIDLSVAGLEAGFISMALTPDDRSGITPYTPTTLMVAPAEQFNAERILKTKLEVGGANNDINPLATRNITLVVNPYLTDTDSWVLMCDKGERPLGPMLIWKQRPDMETDTVVDTRVLKFNSVQRYICGAVEWRGLYGSAGG